MFTSEQLVVYPAQGVGQIERIDSQNIGGSACDFYIVRIRANSITLMVPVKNASNVGLRTLVSTKEAEHIWEALRNNPQQTVHTGQNWNRRFREYSERLKSPDLSIVANVLRELLLIGRTKDLSFGERRLLEQAMSLVTGELGEVLKTEQRDLQSELISLYSPPAKQPATTAHYLFFTCFRPQDRLHAFHTPFFFQSHNIFLHRIAVFR